MIYMFLSNNPSSGDINSWNLNLCMKKFGSEKIIIPLENSVCGGSTVFTLSVHPCVRP